ncbi:HEPN domain-containing protein, partial [Acidocella sp.]|uniref:HEPN domain-containing protein n=1 Tax=Acidocella sp. TaxID=50710 RepID=UPI002610B382
DIMRSTVALKGASVEDDSPQLKKDGSKLVHINNDLQDVLRCLTLIGPCSPVAVGNWTQLVGPGVPATTSGGIGWNHETAFARPIKLGDFNTGDAQTLIKDFLALSPKTRERLRVPLDRLNRAIRGSNVADRAIDLGIAFEAILFHGSEDNNGELAFRLGLRGAWLSGNDAASRQENYRLLKGIYYLRSKAVHTGGLPAKKAKEQPLLMERGIRLCSNLLKSIVHGTHWPDNSTEWDKLIFGA